MNLRLRAELLLKLLLITVSTVQLSTSQVKDVVIIDNCQDANLASWVFPTKWLMFCFENVNSLKENATADKYNTMIPENFEWTSFEHVKGIWAFFYQDPPPELNLPVPVIRYHDPTTSFKSLEITYFMYGNLSDKLTISAPSVKEYVTNACGFKCDLDFVDTDAIQFDANCVEGATYCGASDLSITMDTTPGHSFVFIDKIVGYTSKKATPDESTTLTTASITSIDTSTMAYSTEQLNHTTEADTTGTDTTIDTTETDTTEMDTTTTTYTTGFSEVPEEDAVIVDNCADARDSNWKFPTKWRMFCFNDAKSLKINATADSYNTMIPEDFDWSAFQHATGIWAFFNQDPPPEFDLPVPSIQHLSSNTLYTSLEITYFMYGYKSDHLSISSSSIKKVIPNHCGFNCDLQLVKSEKIQLEKNCGEEGIDCGVLQFNITLNTVPGRSFIFIDKIVAYKAKKPTRSPWKPWTTERATTNFKNNLTTETAGEIESSTANLYSTNTPSGRDSSTTDGTSTEVSKPVATTEEITTLKEGITPTTTCDYDNLSSCNGSRSTLQNTLELTASFILILGALQFAVSH